MAEEKIKRRRSNINPSVSCFASHLLYIHHPKERRHDKIYFNLIQKNQKKGGLV